MSPVYCKKFDSIQTKLTEEIHFDFWSLPLSPQRKYGRDTPIQCYAPSASSTCSLQPPIIAQQTTPFAAGKVWYRRTAKMYVQKLDSGRVHKFGMIKNWATMRHGSLSHSQDKSSKFWDWAFGNMGSGHVWNSQLGTTFGRRSELGAFGLLICKEKTAKISVGVETFSETEAFAKTQVSRHETHQNI